MQVAIPLFPRFTALDAVGPYEVLQRIPGIDVTFLGHRRGEVRSDNGRLGMICDATFDDLPRPDVIVFPGGVGTRQLVDDAGVLDWLRKAHAHTRFTTSVCTGALVLAAAGLLRGLTATTHWRAASMLEQFGAHYVSQRVGSICRSGWSPPPESRRGSTWRCIWWRCWSTGRRPKPLS